MSIIFRKMLSVPRASRAGTPALHCLFKRDLFEDKFLRLDLHRSTRDMFRQRVKGREEKFWERVSLLRTEGVIYFEDLKLICHIAEEENLELMIDSVRRFISGKKVRLSADYKIGPVIMRSLHLLQKPDLALEVFYDKQFQSLFPYGGAIMPFLDLLFESGKYEELIKVYETMMDMQWTVIIKTRAVPVLYALSLYKIGTPETFESARLYWEKTAKHTALRRVPLAVAALALKVDQPEYAINVLKNYSNYYISQNMLIQAHLMSGNWKKAYECGTKIEATSFLRETYNLVKDKADKDPLVAKLKERLSKSSVNEKSIDEYLSSPISFTPEEPEKIMNRRRENASLKNMKEAF